MRKSELKQIIKRDSVFYDAFPKSEKIKMRITKDHFFEIHKYMIFLRHEEYWREKAGKSKCPYFAKIAELIYALRKNRLGNRLGFYIKPGSLGAGTIIYHHGCVIINGGSHLGENCRLHGNNCIGNNGQTHDTPQIGSNVEIGFGASVIGNVRIADNVKIGAGAVVVRDCLQEGATLVGIPAHICK